MKRNLLSQPGAALGYLLLAVSLGTVSYSVSADPLAETREILFNCPLAEPDCEQGEIKAKASELQSPAAMYEYVRNTHEYALYHGSRSNTINTYFGQRGSDVDIASVLIAMYRSQNIPARYATANISVSADQVTNWLGVKNINLAAAIMNDQGIQNVNLTTDGSEQVIEFEHVWVQAQVPYSDYRGAFASPVDCTATPTHCQWINLDPSWKQRQFHNQNIDPYNDPTFSGFDYDRYYNAIKNDDPDFRDKNPLEIYEEQILSWLKINHPGKTLDDVADPGKIIPLHHGILPASLPYKVISSIQTYDSIHAHDDMNNPDWAKFFRARLFLNYQAQNGGNINISGLSITGDIALSELSTKRLTITFEANSDTSIRVPARLDGIEVGNLLGTISIGEQPPIGTPYSLSLILDGAPSTTDGQAQTIQANYNNFVIGGYYLMGTGGDTSNWSQVHRAAEQLLEANQSFPIVNDANQVPYVDSNSNGVIDSGEVRLLDDPIAQDELTGGLLNVAMSQYYTKFVENTRRLDTLNHIISPIEGFVGVVSSTYEVDYLDSTAFSVMPGGLLIDMKGVKFNGTWRNNASSEYANDHFELLGHEGSSLEHEIWQELTGFDAVSTVRGIQMALANGAPLQTPENNGSSDNMVSQYNGFQFSDTVPAGFTYTPFTVFSTQPATWTHASNNAEMDVIKREVTSATPAIYQTKLWSYQFNTGSGLYAWVNCVNGYEDQLLTFLGTDSVGAFTFCDGTVYSGQVSTILSQMEDRYLNIIIPNNIGGTTFNYFDRAQGFNPADFVYRALPLDTNQHDRLRVGNIRNDVMLGTTNSRWEYVIPGLKTEGDLFRFTVFLEKIFDTPSGQLASQSYSISNESFTAGGGWVDGTQTLNAAETLPGTSIIKPTFNNEVFTDQNLVAQTNNDLIRTPSTADPISTVTGNMYHDETDITLKGRGLNYAFTRSYNSGKGRVDQDSPFGYGWTHSYNMQLRSNDYGKCPNCAPGTGAGKTPENGNNITASISYIDERGGEHTYLVNEATQTVSSPPGEFDTLQLNVPSTGKYTLTFRNGTKYIFSGNNLNTTVNQIARLDTIEDPYGNQLNMNYDGSGRLQTIVDNLGIAGRTGLSFTYHGTSQHIHTVKDWTNRTWTYQYDANGNLDSISNPLSQVTDYTYHAGHLLNEMIKPEDRNGQQAKTTFSYYRNNKAFTNANALGQGETVDYDLYRQRTRVTDPRGFIRQHIYDTDNGALTKLNEPDGAILQFKNNADGLRYQKTDGLGYSTHYSFKADRSISNTASDTNGLVTRETDALNQHSDINYGLYDQPTDTTDKRGNRFAQSYYQSTDAINDAIKGKLKQTTATVNGTANILLASYRYYADAAHPAFGQLKQTTEYIDPNNLNRKRITDFVYDASGLNLQSQTMTGSTENDPITLNYGYDTLGRLISQSQSRRTSADDATLINLTTSYQYDDLGRLIKTTNPRGDIQETVYDKNGQVTQQKIHYLTSTAKDHCAAPALQNGQSYVTCTISTNIYDAADRLIQTTDILGYSSHFKYDKVGNLIEQTDANGHLTTYKYDPMNRQTAVINANQYRSELTYDLAGQLIEAKDSNGHTTSTQYDALGRATETTSQQGRQSQTQYDENNNPSHSLDANALANPLHPKNTQNASVYREYDELNRLTLQRDAQNGDTRYSYDLLGNITQITDAENQITQFIYDDLGRLTETIDPKQETPIDNTDKILQYDETGNVLLTEDRSGKQRRMTYDSLNRLIQIDYLTSHGTTQETIGDSDHYQYDDFGDLIQISNNAVSYSYSYTARHELKSKTDNRLNKTLSWTYDPIGNIDTKTNYEGHVTNYQYDNTGKLTALQNQAFLQVSYHYDGAGRLIDRILSNGAKTRYQYDDDNRLIQLINSSANSTEVENLNYQHDEVGNITQIANSSNGKTTDYQYDALYRLINVNSSDNTEDRTYSYDKVGNRKTETKNGISYYYCYHPTDCTQPPQGNRLYSIRTGNPTGSIYRQFSYDDAGRLLQKQDGTGTPIYTVNYNAKGRAQSIVTPNGSQQFEYDPNDYRIKKDNQLYHLEGEHLEATYSQTGELKNNYFRGVIVDEIVSGYTYHSQNPGDWTNYTFYHDHLNSVTALTGHAGSIEETTRYDAFGEILNPASLNSGNELLYTGRQLDRETGLVYYRARYYDTEIDRFITEDPLGLEAGINFYAYVNNNPVNYNDPSGHVLNFALGAAANVVVGGAIRGLTGGDIFDGGAIATDLAIGAATSGLGALAQIRHAKHILNVAKTQGKVVGNAQKTGTFFHAAASEQQAVNLLNQGANKVFLDRAYSTATGIKGAGALRRPDVLGVFDDASVRAIEIASKTDDLGVLASRNFDSIGSLGLADRGVGVIETAFKFTSPIKIGGQRTIGASGFQTGKIGASGIFGGNAITGVNNFNSSSAGGGFVLYPSKPNTNMMNSVYAK